MWLNLAKSLLLPTRQPQSEDVDTESTRETWEGLLEAFLPVAQRRFRDDVGSDQPLPHRSELPSYALRGYSGPPVVISSERYPGAYRASGFVERHVAHMNSRPGLVAQRYVDRDVHNLLELVTQTPVRILPTIHPRP